MATAKQIKTLQVRLDATFGKGKVKATEDTWSKNKAALDTMEAAGKVPILDPSGTLRGEAAKSKTAEVYSDITGEYQGLLSHLSGEEGYNPNFYLDGSGILTTGVGLTAEYVADPSPLKAMTEKTDEAKGLVPNYENLHPQVQLALVDSAYRGDLTNTKDGVVTPQKWVTHVNNGEFRKAAAEHINHAEYNKAKGIGGKNRGLIPRFDWRAAALKRSADPQTIQQMQDRSKEIYAMRELEDKVPESTYISDAIDSVSDFMDNLISTGVFPEQKVPPKTTQDIPVPEQGATVPETENEMATQAQVNSFLKKRNEKQTLPEGARVDIPLRNQPAPTMGGVIVGREPVDTVGEYIGPNEVADNPMYREELKQLMQREDVNRMQQGQLYKVPVPTIDNDIPSVANGGVFPFPAVIPQGTVDPGLLAAANQQQMMMNQGRLQQSQLNMMNPQGTVDPGLVAAAAGQQLAMMQQAAKDSEREPAAIAENNLQQSQLNLVQKGGQGYHYDQNGNLRIVAAPQLTNPAIPMGTVLSGGQPVRASNGSMVGSPTQNPALKAPAGGKGANATPQSAIAQLTGMKGIGGK